MSENTLNTMAEAPTLDAYELPPEHCHATVVTLFPPPIRRQGTSLGPHRHQAPHPQGAISMTDDWYWAAPSNEPAGDRFIIENGQDALWPRVRREIDPHERCYWMPIH